MSFGRRLTLLVAGAVALSIALAAGASYLLVRSELRDTVDDALRREAAVITGGLDRFADGRGPGPPRGTTRGTDPDLGDLPGGPTGPGLPLPPRFELGGSVAQLVSEDGEVLLARGLGEDRLPTGPAEAVLAGGEGGLSDVSVEGVELRLLTVELPGGRVLQLARPLDDVNSSLSDLVTILLLLTLAGVGVAAALGVFVARAALRPVRALTSISGEVARTRDLTRRIGEEGEDELARLARNFNTMLAALERAVDSQRQLVADASHELRTPLTSIRTNVETLLRKPDLGGTDRENLVRDLRGELEELSHLIDDIVHLAREGDAPAAETELDLGEIVAERITALRRRQPGLEVDEELDRSIVRGDPERLARAVGNLLDNAAKWSGGAGPVRVTLERGRLVIRDRGPGFESDELGRVFDRFFRSRAARGTPGSGLGLAIVKQVASSHGGRVEAANHPEGGAVLRFELPVVRDGDGEPLRSARS